MVSTEARRVQRNPEVKAVFPAGRTERQATDGHGLKKVFICSPFRPVGDNREERDKNWKQNISLAKQACHYAVNQGYIPYAPHLYFPLFLSENDPDEREMGIIMGLSWLARCDEIWVCGKRISEGMSREIAQAKEWCIPLKAYLPLPGDRTRVIDANVLNEDEFLKFCAKTEKNAMDKKPENMTVKELVMAMDEDAKHIGLTIADLYRTATMAMASLPNMELHMELIGLSVMDRGITFRVDHSCHDHHESDDDSDDYDEDDMNDFDFEEEESGIYGEF